MPRVDAYDYSLTTQSEAAAAAYREGVALMLAAWPGAKECFEQAIALDPDFALAHSALARWFAMHADMSATRQHIGRAGELAETLSDAREKSHIAILTDSLSGRPQQAISGVLQHLESWPRDVIILSLPLGAFGLYAFSGMREHNEAKAELCKRMASAFSSDDWWFLTYHGWSIAENGEVQAGRELLERAMMLKTDNANGAHALVHCMVEGGDGEIAERYVKDWLPSYDRSGILHGHIAWHRALALLERGDFDAAYTVYQELVRPEASLGMPINVVSDGASFLWRCDLYGHAARREDWDAIADYTLQSFPKAGHAFVDSHAAMAFAGAGRTDALSRRLSEISDKCERSDHQGLPVAARLAESFVAIKRCEYGAAARILGACASDISRIGGSNAQREVFEDTLIVALMMSDQKLAARQIVKERLSRRPSARDQVWMAQLV